MAFRREAILMMRLRACLSMHTKITRRLDGTMRFVFRPSRVPTEAFGFLP
jgi:hypothetical protein